MIKTIAAKHTELWQLPNFRNSAILAFLILPASLVFYYFAASYATKQAGSGINDIILSRLPVFDVSIIFIWAAFAVIIFCFFLILFEPKWLPFVVKSASVFIIIRSVFITLTHLGPPLAIYTTTSQVMKTFNFTGDLFFSGHAGMPFLMALIFWQRKILRNIFLVASFILSLGVLFGHLHYSIDVLAAYFITYSIFSICKKIFAKDYLAFKK